MTGAEVLIGPREDRRPGAGVVRFVVVTGMGKALSAMLGFALVPLVIGTYGVAGYSVYALLIGLPLLLTAVDLGIGNALATQMAVAAGRGDRHELRRLFQSGLVMLAGVALVLELSAAVVIGVVDAGAQIAAGAPINDLDSTLLWFFSLWMVALPLQVAGRLEMAVGRVGIAGAYAAATAVLPLLSGLAAVLLGGDLRTMVLLNIAAVLLTSIVQFAHVVLRDPTLLSARYTAPALQGCAGLFKAGWSFLFVTMATSAALYLDPWIIVSTSGYEAVAQYSVTCMLFNVPLFLFNMVQSPLWAAYGRALGAGDIGYVRATFRRSVRAGAAWATAVLVILLPLAPWILLVWIGAGVVPPLSLLVVQGLLTGLLVIQASVTVLLNAHGVVSVQARTLSVFAVVNVPLSFGLATVLGPAGPVLASVICAVPSLVYFFVVARRLMARPQESTTRTC